MTTEDLFWLSVNAYHEARGEIIEGKIAICHVVFNRAKSKKKSIKEVVLQPYQFSWANGGKRPVIDDYSAFEECIKAAMTTEEDRLKGDAMAGVDHYYAHKGKNAIKQPTWVAAGAMRLVASIGNHLFFKS